MTDDAEKLRALTEKYARLGGNFPETLARLELASGKQIEAVVFKGATRRTLAPDGSLVIEHLGSRSVRTDELGDVAERVPDDPPKKTPKDPQKGLFS